MWKDLSESDLPQVVVRLSGERVGVGHENVRIMVHNFLTCKRTFHTPMKANLGLTADSEK